MALGKFANRIVGSGEESLDQIQFNPRNWRVHPLNQQSALKGVLEEVGWVQEVIINQRTGHLVDGHLRCQLAAREGAKTIPVKYVDLSEDEEALVLSTLDPIAAMAVTDKQKLDDLFASIETENADVLKMLDDIAEKERLEYAKRDPVDAEPQIDRAAELNEKWQVVTGDLWQIGEHRLLCGDSTNREDVERVGNKECDFSFTDPPYNVGVKYTDATNDNQGKQEFIEWCRGWTQALPARHLLTVGIKRLVWWGDILGDPQWIIAWVKRNGQGQTALGGTNKWDAVLVYGVEPDHKTDLIELNNDYSEKIKAEGAHPTAKPVELWQQIIERFNGQIVYEPFCGSGTTMVACQNLNRKCRAIEISPNYCAVILERMSTAFPELEIKKVD